MRATIMNGILLVGMAILIGVGCAAGYWYVQSHGGVDASVIDLHTDAALDTATDAHAGTPTEHVTDVTLVSEEYERVRRAVEGMSADDALAYIESRLELSDVSGAESTQLEASLGLALLAADPPDAEAARSAFARAFGACPDADARVHLAYAYAQLLYERGHYEVTLELLNAGRFVGAQFSPERLAIEVIRGMTLDALGRGPAAQDVYERALESALASELHNSARARDAARLIGLRLARSYRDTGRHEDAVAISRMLRAWLGEDDLVDR